MRSLNWVPILLVLLGFVLTAGSALSYDGSLSTAIQAGATVGLVVLTGWYAWHTQRLAQSAERQIKSMEKQGVSQIIFELYRTYNAPEMQQAIRTIYDSYQEWQGTLSEDQKSGLNEMRYHFGQSFWNRVQQGDEIDKMRRKVTQFWYQVGFLLEQEMINKEWAFEAFGPPQIVDILEPIEVVLADEVIGDPSRPRLWDQRQKWPPMFALRTWKTSEPSKKTPLLRDEVPLDDMIPVDRQLYDRYREATN